MSDESQIDKAKKVAEGKKPAVAYLKARVEDLDRTMALNFQKGNFSLAAMDARQMTALLETIGQLSME